MSREMKDSGIEWIGEIPKNWEIIRLKNCILSRDAGAWGTDSTGEEGDIICLRIADFDYSRFKFKDIEIGQLTKRHYDKATIAKLVLKQNDILIEKSGGGEKTPVGRTVIFDKKYNALYANFMDRIRCSANILPYYLQYVFVTFYKNGYTFNYIKQTTGIQNLDLTTMLSSEKIALPSYNEQTLISEFLNHKCSQIDSIIAKTQKSIDEYKALKQSIITEAVTKGIRGERPMKDSGIEWIGEIPADWNLIKITHLLDYSYNYPLGDGDHGLISPNDYCQEGVPYIRVQNLGWAEPISVSNIVYISKEKNEIIKNSTLRPGDILFAKTGATIGKTALIPDFFPISNTTSHVGKITFDPFYNNRFLYYQLSSFVGYKQMWDIACEKTTRPELSIEEVKSFHFIVPNSFKEQVDIINYLDIKCKLIEDVIEVKKKLLTELESYKKSLIYEYVTGKKEVS